MHYCNYNYKYICKYKHITVHYTTLSTLHYTTATTISTTTLRHTIALHYTTITTMTTLLHTSLSYTSLHYTILHHPTLHYTTAVHNTTVHFTTLRYTTLITQHHNYNCNYTTVTTLHYNYNSTTLQLQLQLHYTTLQSTSCGWRDHCNHCNHSKKHNSNHFSVHHWIRSAIHASQRLASLIVSYLWNFRRRLVRYYRYPNMPQSSPYIVREIPCFPEPSDTWALWYFFFWRLAGPQGFPTEHKPNTNRGAKLT